MIVDQETDPRIAGEISRYHTWRTIRTQSVGEHSWQLLRILTTIWPDAPRRLFMAALYHDVGEMAGDIPWPGKRNDPDLKVKMDAAEARIHDGMSTSWGMPARITNLPHFEERVLKLCDNLEMWEFGLVEQNMGNAYAAVVAMRMLLASSEILETLLPHDNYPDLRPAFKKYVELRKQQERGENK